MFVVRSTTRRVILALGVATAALAVSPAVHAQTTDDTDASEIKSLEQDLAAQRAATLRLTRRLSALEKKTGLQAKATLDAQTALEAKTAIETQNAIKAQATLDRQNTLEAQKAVEPALSPPAQVKAGFAGYDGGFYVEDASGNNSLHIDGLLQPRFTYFAPRGTSQYGGSDQSSANFNVFLGRLYFSGNLIDPSITYFFTLQGTTTGNGSGITLLDAEMAKKFSPYLTIEAGKYWSSYTYEYYDDIGKYLLPDLSAAEWAFSLGRQTGVRVSGTAGKLTYRFSVSNAIPGSDVGSSENFNTNTAEIANLQYDVLAPYGYQESDPSPGGATKPELTVWAAAMYNPVNTSSAFENEIAGDRTYGATANLNFRYGYFSFQGSGYYKNNNSWEGVHGSYNSAGWQEQAGYYLIPSKLEIAERVDGIDWGYGEIPDTGGSEVQWFAGPSNFSFHHLTEYTGGLNYYFHGHNFKTQLQYSYMDGSGFNKGGFSANRVVLQGQLEF